MSSDSFSTAIPLLQLHSKASIPHLYHHLSSLLTRYTSGLSLPITLDTLPSNTTSPVYHELRVITTRSSPELHLLKPLHSSNHHHAFFPPHTLPPLPPGTIVRLPLTRISSDALILAKNLFPDTDITHAHLPTLDVLILLPFPKPLPLPHPYQTYTLQTIWNLRDLTPPAVYATLHSVSIKHASLTLVDDPDSPPVTLQLLPTRNPILRCLTPPCMLLITAPLVTPSDNAFSLQDTPSSTYFMLPLPSKKRRREESSTLFTPRELSHRATKDIAHPITVHARVKDFTNLDSGACVLDLGGVHVVIPHHPVEKADEIVLMGVIFRNRWYANRVKNISTMLGMLYCPFLAKFISIQKAEALCGGSEFLTAFLRVRVTAVETRDMVRLIVEDCGESSEEDDNCSRRDVHRGRGRGVVCLKNRGFLQMFGMTKKGFEQMECDQVCAVVKAIRGVVWRVIVSCGVAEVPVLTACLRAS